ncbi:MAG: aminoacyl-tRNA deacylase [Chloroflexi bacterium]|nr:MAG: aminoacyl-tRNA deacylase [Chloroflexota bacterium]
MAKETKTIGMKLLEGKKVGYETAVYPPTIRDAEQVADAVNQDPNIVYKTLVVKPPEGNVKAKPMLVLVQSNMQLNLKKLAKAVKAKKLKMATQKEAEKLTGLQVGGISPLALVNKGFAIYLDESAQSLDKIVISAGQRGIQIIVGVKDLVKVTRARFVDVTG